MSNLSDYCRDKGIRTRFLTEEDLTRYRENRPSSEVMLSTMAELDQLMDHDVILIGGLSATSKLLGYRKMRKTSNDLDCVTSYHGIDLLHKLFGDQLFVTENYGDLFLDYNGIPCGFDVGETHGWEIPSDFFDQTRTFNFGEQRITTISPEYLFTLKLRRTLFKERIYGKDKLDLANISLAPRFREDLEELDMDQTANLLRLHASPDYDKIFYWVFQLNTVTNHLREEERDVYRDLLGNLDYALKKVYLSQSVQVI